MTSIARFSSIPNSLELVDRVVFYHRYDELVSKFNVGLKSLLHQGLSEPEFYGDLVYKVKKIMGRTDFSSPEPKAQR